MAVVLWATTALAAPAEWRGEWPNTDFSRHSVDYAEIISGGPPRDGIPAIDAPRFKALDAVDLADSATGHRAHRQWRQPRLCLAF